MSRYIIILVDPLFDFRFVVAEFGKGSFPKFTEGLVGERMITLAQQKSHRFQGHSGTSFSKEKKHLVALNAES